MTDDPIHMPIARDRACIAVIRAQNEVAGIQAPFRDRGDLGLDIIPGRAQAQHCTHTATHPRDGIGFTRALVIVGRPTGQIGMEGRTEIGRRIVPPHNLARRLSCCNFCQHLRIGISDTGEVHHLAQADNAGPRHGFRHLFGAQFDAGCFQARCRRGTRRHLNKHVDGLLHRLVMHQPDTGQAHDIRDFVWIDKDRRRPTQRHRAHKFGNRQHRAFDVHVCVTQARHQEPPACIDDARLLADHRPRVVTAKGKTSIGNGDIDPQDQLGRLDIDPGTTTDHRVGGFASTCHSDQPRCALTPWFDVHVPPPAWRKDRLPYVNRQL